MYVAHATTSTRSMWPGLPKRLDTPVLEQRNGNITNFTTLCVLQYAG